MRCFVQLHKKTKLTYKITGNVVLVSANQRVRSSLRVQNTTMFGVSTVKGDLDAFTVGA